MTDQDATETGGVRPLVKTSPASKERSTPPADSESPPKDGKPSQEDPPASDTAAPLPPEKQVSKLKRFLATVHQFATNIDVRVGAQVKSLVLDLVLANLTVDEFFKRLPPSTKFPFRPSVVPFLKSTLPLLREELAESSKAITESLLFCPNSPPPMTTVLAPKNAMAPGNSGSDPAKSSGTPRYHDTSTKDCMNNENSNCSNSPNNSQDGHNDSDNACNKPKSTTDSHDITHNGNGHQDSNGSVTNGQLVSPQCSSPHTSTTSNNPMDVANKMSNNERDNANNSNNENISNKKSTGGPCGDTSTTNGTTVPSLVKCKTEEGVSSAIKSPRKSHPGQVVQQKVTPISGPLQQSIGKKRKLSASTISHKPTTSTSTFPGPPPMKMAPTAAIFKGLSSAVRTSSVSSSVCKTKTATVAPPLSKPATTPSLTPMPAINTSGGYTLEGLLPLNGETDGIPRAGLFSPLGGVGVPNGSIQALVAAYQAKQQDQQRLQHQQQQQQSFRNPSQQQQQQQQQPFQPDPSLLLQVRNGLQDNVGADWDAYAKEWKNIETMFSGMTSMMDQLRSSMLLFQHRVRLFQLWNSSSNGPRPSPDSGGKGETDKLVEQVKRQADENVQSVKRQAVAELQKAVNTAEQKAAKALATERGQMERTLREVHKQFAMQEDKPENCWNCGRRANQTCSGCQTARYCGQFCQHRDWNRHRFTCGPRGQAASGGSNGPRKDASQAVPPINFPPTPTGQPGGFEGVLDPAWLLSLRTPFVFPQANNDAAGFEAQQRVLMEFLANQSSLHGNSAANNTGDGETSINGNGVCNTGNDDSSSQSDAGRNTGNVDTSNHDAATASATVTTSGDFNEYSPTEAPLSAHGFNVAALAKSSGFTDVFSNPFNINAAAFLQETLASLMKQQELQQQQQQPQQPQQPEAEDDYIDVVPPKASTSDCTNATVTTTANSDIPTGVGPISLQPLTHKLVPRAQKNTEALLPDKSVKTEQRSPRDFQAGDQCSESLPAPTSPVIGVGCQDAASRHHSLALNEIAGRTVSQSV